MDCLTEIRLRRRSKAYGKLPLPEVSSQLFSVPRRIELTLERARFDVPSDCSVELSPLGVKFFTETFEAFDKVTKDLLGPTYTYCVDL